LDSIQCFSGTDFDIAIYEFPDDRAYLRELESQVAHYGILAAIDSEKRLPGRDGKYSMIFRSDDMSIKLYLAISGVIFFLVGILHLLRLLYHWPIIYGTMIVPHALSYGGFPVSIGYSVWACWLLFRK
jgi:hypothetical protein